MQTHRTSLGMSTQTPVPSRYVNLEQARVRHGERVDRLGQYFNLGDPLADTAVLALSDFSPVEREALLDRCLREGARPQDPEALRALMRQVERVPFWVDLARCDRGGATFLRSGLAGGLIHVADPELS